MRVADVALDPRSGGADALYTYRADERLTMGSAVFVPLGSRPVLGFVVEVREVSESDLGFPLSALKSITALVEGLALPEEIVQLARFVAQESLCSLPVALGPAIPPGVRERLVSVWMLTPDATPNGLTTMQKEVFRVLQEKEGGLVESKGSKLPPASLRALRAMAKVGVVTRTLRLQPFTERRAQEPMLRLAGDATKVEAFLRGEGKRRPAQALTIMRLQGSTRAQLTSSEVRALSGVTETTVKALLTAGLLERVDEDEPSLAKPPRPNDAQSLAIEAVNEALRARQPHPFLLFGVTGSGKTEVYLRAAAEALREGRQVLFLVPEIALAAQTLARLRERFGRTVAVLHSELAPAERLQNWFRIRSGQASVVLGARSALFGPLTNLGLIVMDEEHEASYKQESSPRYHAAPLVRHLAHLHSCPVVFGSATPSVEAFVEAEDNEEKRDPSRMTLLTLPERAASAQLPEVVIHDLTSDYRDGKPALLCQDLHDAIEATLSRGEQVILFLNRRAYAPFVICRDCGKQMQCPSCAVSLSYHRRERRLRCHHCGFSQVPPDACPNCEGMRLSPFGAGTEKVEEAVAALFPQTKVARLDRDVARKKGALEETLAAFRAGEIGILVGTQMVAKGLDFPNVTLVGVVAADVSLNIPDFRASERTFQLLTQVAGRAGRGIRAGRVFIQTFNPTHPSVLSSQTHNFIAMLESLKKERQDAGYPPYVRLVNIVLSGENRSAVIRASEEAHQRLLPTGTDILGPVDCAVERIQNRWRRHLLIKLPFGSSAEPIGHALEGFEPPGVLVVVDVDPYNLM